MPDSTAAVGVLPENIALAVAVEIAPLPDAPAGAGPINPAPPVMPVPFTSQTALLPSVFCQRMSLCRRR
jgi:hypothetical protein